MPILLVLLLTAACLPVEWPAPPLGLGAAAAAGLTAAAVALPLAAAAGLRAWVVRTLRRAPDRRFEVGNAYGRLRRRLFFVNLAAVAGAVLGLGWGWAVRHTLLVEWHDDRILAPFAELAVPLPYFLVLLGCWLIYYDAERALHRAAFPEGERSFWSRGGYVFNQVRQLALLVGLPVGLFVTQQTLLRVAPELTASDEYRLASVAALPLVVLFAPLIVRPLLGLRAMPAGPVRARLEAVARRLGFRYTNLLVWKTHGAVANAMIIGVLPRARYVVFTDRLLDEMPPDELDAVFGHEAGHARHGHIGYYAAFLVLSLTALVALVMYGAQHLDALAAADPDGWAARLGRDDAGWMAVPPLALAGAYLFVVFGYLSRRCERQADIFGCRTVSCGNPACTGHDEATRYPEGGTALCPTGIRTCARALERVYYANGFDGADGGPRTLRSVLRGAGAWLRAWQHAPMPRRVAFLLSLIDDPARERRFQRRVFLLRWGLAVGLVAALVVLGEAVTWRELLRAL